MISKRKVLEGPLSFEGEGARAPNPLFKGENPVLGIGWGLVNIGNETDPGSLYKPPCQLKGFQGVVSVLLAGYNEAKLKSCGSSSSGRASALQADGGGFESRLPLDR